jgi:hypothetical protein
LKKALHATDEEIFKLKKALHSTDDICASQPKLRQPVKAEIRAETLGLFFGIKKFFAKRSVPTME